MTKVLVVSDTHTHNDKWIELINKLKPNVILHCGDHCTQEEIMNKYATYWVAGNNDIYGEEIKIFNIENVKFILMHGHQASRIDLKKWKLNLIQLAKQNNVNVLVYGHSHIQDIDEIDNIIAINPGSLEYPRNPELLPTYITFDVDNDKVINIKIHYYNVN